MKKKILSLACVLVSAITFAQLPTSGLVAHYPFNGNANDESTNSNHGTVNGATLTTDRFGNVNSAYSFDGFNDYIEVPSINNLLNYTVSTWVKLNSVSDTNTIISKGLLHKGTLELYHATDYLHNSVFNVNNERGYLSSQSALEANKYFNITSTYDGFNMKLYVNGELLKERGDINDDLAQNDSSLFIGAVKSDWVASFSEDHFIKGKIDELGIWNRALTQQEITSLYTGDSCNLYLDLGNDISICSGDNIELDAGIGWKVNTWTWGSNIETTQKISVTGLAGDTVGISLAVEDKNGCKGDTILHLIIDTLPTPFVDNDTICFGSNAVEFDAGIGWKTNTWTWDGNTKVDQKINVNGSAGDTVRISLAVEDKNGCKGDTVLHLIIATLPTLDLGNDISIFLEQNITLDAGPGWEVNTWTWGSNIEITQKISVTGSVGDTFRISLAVEDDNGCEGFDTINISTESYLIHNDTINLNIGNLEFEPFSPQVKYLGNDTINNENNNYDSIISVYANYIYNNSSNCLDTIEVTVQDTLNIYLSDFITSVNDASQAATTVKVYPNPTENEVTVSIDNYTNLSGVSIKVLDALGTVVHQQLITGSTQSIEVSLWKSGVYFLHVMNSSKTVDIRKIVVNN